MKMSFKRSNLGFFLMDGMFFASYCAMFGFTTTILLDYGYTVAQCGMVNTLQFVVFMLNQPIYGYLLDNVISAKKLLMVMILGGITMAAFLPWVFTQGVLVVTGYITIMSFFIFSGGPITDTWVIAVINKTRGMDYGLIRCGGSVFYAFTALIAGNLITTWGIEVLFLIHILLGALTMVIAFFMVDDKKIESTRDEREKIKKLSFKKSITVLFKNKDYIVFLVCMCIFNFATKLSSTYLPMVIDSVGGDSGHFGLAVFLGSLGEVGVMLLASRIMIRGVPPVYLYGVAVLVCALRYFIMGVSDVLWVILATQLVQAVGFGLNLRINAEYVIHIAPKGYEGMALLFLGAIANGVGSMLGSFMGGQIIQQWGLTPYIYLCTGCMLTVFVVFIPTILRTHKERVAHKLDYLLARSMATQPREEEVESNS